MCVYVYVCTCVHVYVCVCVCVCGGREIRGREKERTKMYINMKMNARIMKMYVDTKVYVRRHENVCMNSPNVCTH